MYSTDLTVDLTVIFYNQCVWIMYESCVQVLILYDSFIFNSNYKSCYVFMVIINNT